MILVTGGSGWIGRQVVREIMDRGYPVLSMHYSKAGGGEAQSIHADIASSNFRTLSRDPRLRDIDAVIHCAGLAHRPNETKALERMFDAVNREGTMNVLELAKRSKARRFVYLSSIAFYRRAHGAPCREDSPLAADSMYARSKLAGEVACLESGMDCRIARLATVFGVGDRANFARLASAMARRRFVIPGDGSARKSVIPIDVVAELLVDLATRDSIQHSVINIGLPKAPALVEICEAYSEACGFATPRRVPVGVMNAAAFVGDAIGRICPGFPLTSTNVKKLTASTTVDVNRMCETWPDRKWPSFRDALQRSSEYYRHFASPPR